MNPAQPADEHLIPQARRLSLDELPPPQPLGRERSTRSPSPCADDDEHVRTGVASPVRADLGENGVATAARPRCHASGQIIVMKEKDTDQNHAPDSPPSRYPVTGASRGLDDFPTEILFRILEFLDINDLLVTSRTSHHLRSVSLTPLLHMYRLRRTREVLPPLLWSPARPTLADLIAKSIFLTKTSVVSRRLGRSLVSIRLAHRLASRPSAEALVERAVLPRECVPGMANVQVAPAIIQRRKVIERERIKDGLRRWIEGKWRGEVKEREECQRKWEESRGVGRVWRLRKFWERMGRGEEQLLVR